MQVPKGEFRFPPTALVVCGPGSLELVGQKVDEAGARRVLVVTGKSIATKTDLVDRAKRSLGNKFAGVYSGVVQHVPRSCVVEGARIARELKADLLISLGGSSTGDAAKAMNLVLSESERIDDFFPRFQDPEAVKSARFNKPKLWQIAIPTTLSGGEFRPDIGVTDTVRKVKDVFRDAAVTPKVIILDQDVTIYTPNDLWGATGLKNLSDAFGFACSPVPVPFVNALTLRSIQIVDEYLVASVGRPTDLNARGMLQHSAWLSAFTAGATGLGVVPALRHQIGGIYNVPHGVASTVIFLPGIEFNRPAIDEYLARIAKALELPFKNTTDAADRVIKRVKDIIRDIGLPTRLRDAGVPKDGLRIIAQAAMHERALKSNLRQIDSEEQLMGILEKAW